MGLWMRRRQRCKLLTQLNQPVVIKEEIKDKCEKVEGGKDGNTSRDKVKRSRRDKQK